MMDVKGDGYAADIRIESWSGGTRSVRTASGAIYRKPGGWYVRYADVDDALGESSNTIKIAPGELKIIRRGAVESEMTFVVGRRRSGWFRTALFSAECEVHCTEIRVDLHEGRGTVTWAYELRLAGAEPQHHRVKLSVS